MLLLGGPEDRPLTPREQRWGEIVLAIGAGVAVAAILGWLL